MIRRPPPRRLVLLGWAAAAAWGVAPILRPAQAPPPASAPAATAGAAASAPPADSAPEPKRLIPASHPPLLAARGVTGTATIECVVNERGRVVSTRVREASLPEFGQAAMEAARAWQFDPGRRGGRPAVWTVVMPFTFNLSFEKKLEEAAHRKIFTEFSQEPVEADSLAQWPLPVNASLPDYPATLKGSGITGKVLIAFVVDEKGRSMNPRVVRAAHADFIGPALLTVLDLEFKPTIDPKRGPVPVAMIMEFDFNENSAASRPE